MNKLLIVTAVLMITVQGVAMKLYSQKCKPNLTESIVFNLFFAVISVVFLPLLFGGIGTISLPTLLIGGAFGLVKTGTNFCYYLAIASGALSLSSLCLSCSLVVPVLVGLVFWNESVNTWQIAGLFFLLAALLSGVNKQDGKWKLLWLLYGLGTLLCNGMVSVTQKLHQMVLPGQESTGFLLVGNIVSAVLFIFIYLWFRHGKKIKPQARLNGFFWLAVGIPAVLGLLVNQIMMHLSISTPSVILFPLVNGGTILSSSLVAVLLLREHLSMKQITGVLCGVAAVVLLGAAA